jgi:N-methylhydantoinase A/oxoprolinase/acetone carboxylase beta subunit
MIISKALKKCLGEQITEHIKKFLVKNREAIKEKDLRSADVELQIHIDIDVKYEGGDYHLEIDYPNENKEVRTTVNLC